MVLLLALCYLLTIVAFAGAALVSGLHSLCDTCQGQDPTATEVGLVLAGVVFAALSVALTRWSIRRRR